MYLYRDFEQPGQLVKLQNEAVSTAHYFARDVLKLLPVAMITVL